MPFSAINGDAGNYKSTNLRENVATAVSCRRGDKESVSVTKALALA